MTLLSVAAHHIDAAPAWVNINVNRRAVQDVDANLFLAKLRPYTVTIRNAATLKRPGKLEVLPPGEHQFTAATMEELRKILPDGTWMSMSEPIVSFKLTLSEENFPKFVNVTAPAKLLGIETEAPEFSLSTSTDAEKLSLVAVNAEDTDYFGGSARRSQFPGFQAAYDLTEGSLINTSNIDRLGNQLKLQLPVSLGEPVKQVGVKLPFQTNFVLDITASKTKRELPVTVVYESTVGAQMKTKYDPALSDRGFVQWTGNGHWYKAITAKSGISWQDAEIIAESEGGHLATITSADEQKFIAELVDSRNYFSLETPIEGPWLGGYCPSSRKSSSEGWKWITGELWNFTNWDKSEPNNLRTSLGAENRLSILSRECRWNDRQAGFRLPSYIIEVDYFHPQVLQLPKQYR